MLVKLIYHALPRSEITLPQKNVFLTWGGTRVLHSDQNLGMERRDAELWIADYARPLKPVLRIINRAERLLQDGKLQRSLCDVIGITYERFGPIASGIDEVVENGDVYVKVILYHANEAHTLRVIRWDNAMGYRESTESVD